MLGTLQKSRPWVKSVAFYNLIRVSNTLSTKTYRDEYRSASLAKLLRQALVAEAICEVDRRGLKTLQKPLIRKKIYPKI